ncbi:MAG: hypothetical protein QM773_04000 [Hyphomonadaceae bacterium]
MSEETTGEAVPQKKRWPMRVLFFFIAFFISIAIGKVFEVVSDPETLVSAKATQQEWLHTVEGTSPIAVASTYWLELKGAWTGDFSEGAWSAFEADGKGKGIVTPVYALVITGARFFYEGGIPIIIQLVLGALGVAVFNFMRTNGETILFENELTTLLFGPIAVILAASIIGMVLWALMTGGLYALGWATDFAAWAIGATGIAGFCVFCFGELGKKGVEHVLTPKLKG